MRIPVRAPITVCIKACDRLTARPGERIWKLGSGDPGTLDTAVDHERLVGVSKGDLDICIYKSIQVQRLQIGLRVVGMKGNCCE